MDTDKGASNSRWLLYLAGGLVVEVCCLLVVLGAWIGRRGLPISTQPEVTYPIIPSLASSPIIASTHPPDQNTPISVSTPELPQNTPIQSTLSPTPTQTPIRQAFSELPPGKIVFTCFDGQYDQICLMNADGANVKQLTFEKATNFYPSLSPDGQNIVFSSRRDGNFEIFMMDIDGRNVIQLSHDLGNLYAPEISPKGNRIIFTNESGKHQSIWVMKTDGSNPRELFESSGSDIDPTWSPTGGQVLFTSGMTGDNQLYIYHLETERLVPVMRENLDIGGRSSWSPDGVWLAFYAGPKADHDIYIISPEGGGLQQLTFGGDNLAPSFSPDGSWLAFTSFRDGNNEIYLYHLDTQKAYRLTNNSLSDWQPRWGP